MPSTPTIRRRVSSRAPARARVGGPPEAPPATAITEMRDTPRTDRRAVPGSAPGVAERQGHSAAARAVRSRRAVGRSRRRPAPPVRRRARTLPAARVPVALVPVASPRVPPEALAADPVAQVVPAVPVVEVVPVGPVAVPVVVAPARAGSVARRVVPAVAVVVATRTSCSRSSPPTRAPTRRSPRARSSSSVVCRPRSSLRS